MTTDEFEAILTRRLFLTKQVLGSKAAEYAHGDRLSNFNRAGEMLRCSRERALVGMMAKHWISILDIVDGMDARPLQWNPSHAIIEEKIGDAINYLILLEAMLKADTTNQPSKGV